ncbi:MAG: DUF1778 domain-containing protein [Thermomicrobiales bacterium]
MATPIARRSQRERIELDATKREHAVLTRAAALAHMDTTNFALPEVQTVVVLDERIILDERDTDFILTLLEDPPAPSPQLNQAILEMQQHRA